MSATRHLANGPQGIRFKLSPKNGVYAGWFLGVAAPADDPPPASPKLLTLVKDVKDATIVTYEKTYHEPKLRK